MRWYFFHDSGADKTNFNITAGHNPDCSINILDVDPGYGIDRAMRQSSKTSHGPDHKHHQITPAFRPLEGKGLSESQGIKELTPMR
ncbi:hypothetical protein WN51_08663 [Melipona quadrifasciata]|uniref:Uncharacterized protein n=1 Tax=Melipona quadrifasciata TaxID=166423 RepID=A0A0N0BJA7_9HYME|nr:hypothetical protein WN51_08663 [Melipona quadrifasciata]